MNEPPLDRPSVHPARSFDLAADPYDRGRPSYPPEAVDRLLHGVRRTGPAPDVVELGAGTGQLTEALVDRGCRVVATDASAAMLRRLRRRASDAHAVVGKAERVPVRGRTADLVVAAGAFSWFEAEPFLREVARVLRPGGRLAVVWSERDERIPWVRRLGRILGESGAPGPDDPTAAIDESAMFETVERGTHRSWQPMTQESLRALVASCPRVALASEPERERTLRDADELYAGYGRGHDGMLMPYITTVCVTTVLPWAVPADAAPPAPATGSLPGGGAPGDPDDDALLIDFR